MKRFLVAVAVILVGAGVWYWYTQPGPPAVVRRLAPPGVYFLVQRVSVTTDAGVLGFAEGTRVQAVADAGEKIRVREGATEFDVEKKNVTNDLDIAAAAAQRDAGSRRKFDAWMQQQKRALEKQKQEEAAAVQRNEQWRKQHALPPIGTTPNPLDRPAYNPH